MRRSPPSPRIMVNGPIKRAPRVEWVPGRPISGMATGPAAYNARMLPLRPLTVWRGITGGKTMDKTVAMAVSVNRWERRLGFAGMMLAGLAADVTAGPA